MQRKSNQASQRTYRRLFESFPFHYRSRVQATRADLSWKEGQTPKMIMISNSNFDFHINVCRGITAEKTGDTQNCPTNSSLCRIDKKLQTTKDLGNINYASNLYFSPQNDIILVYNTTKKVDGCFPVTTITFKCSKQMVSKQCKHVMGRL